jgi:hypothetical protein
MIELSCRHSLIVYTGETVWVEPRRWWFTSYYRVFRIDGQWPLNLRQAIRQRYWRRPRGRIFQVNDMLPIEIVARSGHWPRRRPAGLSFGSVSRPEWKMTVSISPGVLLRNPGIIHHINEAIAGVPFSVAFPGDWYGDPRGDDIDQDLGGPQSPL